MKKLTLLLLPILLLSYLVFSYGLYAARNNLQFERVDEVGNASGIQDVAYSFALTYGIKYWDVHVDGTNIQVSYEDTMLPGDPASLSLYAQPALKDVTLADEAIVCPDASSTSDDEEGDVDCTITGKVTELPFWISLTRYDANGSLVNEPYKEKLTIARDDETSFPISAWKRDDDFFSMMTIGENDNSTHLNANYQSNYIAHEGEEYYFISEQLIAKDLSKNSMHCKEDIGGIYHIKNDGKQERITPMTLGKEDIYGIVAGDDMIFTLLRREDKNYLASYDYNGKKQHEVALDGIIQVDVFSAVSDGFLISVLQEDGTMRVYLYDDALRRINTFRLEEDLNGEGAYAYRDGRLYVLNGMMNRVVLTVYEQDAVYYKGYVCPKNEIEGEDLYNGVDYEEYPRRVNAQSYYITNYKLADMKKD